MNADFLTSGSEIEGDKLKHLEAQTVSFACVIIWSASQSVLIPNCLLTARETSVLQYELQHAVRNNNGSLALPELKPGATYRGSFIKSLPR